MVVGGKEVTEPVKGARVVDGVGGSVGSGMPPSEHVQTIMCSGLRIYHLQCLLKLVMYGQL